MMMIKERMQSSGSGGFFFYSLWIFLATIILSGFGTEAVKIVELRVPQTVLNGTSLSDEPTILDCDYILEEAETPQGVVVKWFHNRASSPVYQWIYGQKPRALGILRGRLDLTYRASEEEWNAHRAMSIINPTTELTGDWLCRVSTYKNDAMKTAKMIVFAPQREMDIVIVNRPTPDSFNISCWATGVYPEPKLTITYNSLPLDDVITDSTWNDGAYDVVVHKVVEDSDLLSPIPVIFDCELKIPNTSYIHRKNLLYAGPIKGMEDANSASKVSRTFFYTNLLIACWILLLI